MTAARQLTGRAAPAVPDPADAVPNWFSDALAAPPEQRSTTVAGARIHYRVWGPITGRGVVLVHGGAAHSGWWDHIGPLLTGCRVVAPDLSGCGDSEHRPTYRHETWAREVVEVAAAEGLDRPTAIGHSKGGWICVTAGARFGTRLGGVVAIDSPLHVNPPSEAFNRRRRTPTSLYPTRAAVVERFVTTPAQELVLPFVRQHIAEHSVRQVEGGWTWKFDPGSFSRIDDQRELLGALEIPFAYFRCEHGLVSEAMADEIAGLVPSRPPVVTLAGAGHHPMLDHPLSLVAALRTLLAVWP